MATRGQKEKGGVVLFFVILIFIRGVIAGLDNCGQCDSHFVKQNTIIPINRLIVISEYIEKNQRNLDENIHGVLLQETTDPADGSISDGNNLTFNKGIGKIFFAINAGSDVIGTLTINGSTVNRNTQAVTSNHYEDIVIDELTVNNTISDAGGNTVHDFSNGYLTSKWYKGEVTVSTTNLVITDMDVHHISFEQFNDEPNITINTFDSNFQITNSAAELFAYLYLVDVDGNDCNISSIANLTLVSSDSIADEYYRLRRGNINRLINGSKDGVFIDLFLLPDTQTYFTDLTLKIHASITELVNITV